MEENYRLEKEYKIPYETFKEAYTLFQKKNVYPKSYLFMGLFIVIAIIYIAAAVKDPTNKLAYVLIFLSLALAAREWYNPRKIRRSILDTIKSENLEDVVYKISVGDEYVDISTLPQENVENFDVSPEENDDAQDENPPEASRIPINSDLSVQEYEKFFLLHIRKSMFYVVPKDNFSEDELEIIRNLQTIK
jgi:hypothetical protein